MKYSTLCVFLALASGIVLRAQTPMALTYEDYYRQVANFHPMALQAALKVEEAAGAARAARGGFDPKLYFDQSRKDFDDKQYYNYTEAGVLIPVWAGVDVEANYFLSSGEFLNPQLNAPQDGLISLGVSIPLLRGLVMDRRRAAVKEAAAYENLTEFERIDKVNDLLLKAIETYWDWVLLYEQRNVFQLAVEAAEIRFQAIKRSFQVGQLPAIDTLEAFIQVQNRQLSLNDAELFLQQATLELNTYLWAENGIPLQINENVLPGSTINVEDYTYTFDETQLVAVVDVHPQLMAVKEFRNVLDVKRIKATNDMLPELSLKYRFLSTQQPLPEWELNNSLNPQNYTFGIKASVPLFLRKERGNLQIVNAQLRSNLWEIDFMRFDLENQVKQELRGFETATKQAILQKEIKNNTRSLFEFETRKFQVGESSLFLINAREVTAIDAENAWLRAQARVQKSAAKVDWAAGRLFTN
ncbi:MAG: TolC family protein [Schleiferiaceae bacterium]|nr:TolC family protein [Schleiferiaceae bacterium]